MTYTTLLMETLQIQKSLEQLNKSKYRLHELLQQQDLPPETITIINNTIEQISTEYNQTELLLNHPPLKEFNDALNAITKVQTQKNGLIQWMVLHFNQSKNLTIPQEEFLCKKHESLIRHTR